MHKTIVLIVATLALASVGFADTVTMLKPGEYALAVSVGSRIGTPEIALPLEGQVGTTRRYVLGEVVVNENRH